MNTPVADKQPRGARASNIGMRAQLQAWRGHHRECLLGSLQRLWSSPLQTLLTWLVIAIALILPSALYVGLENASQLGQSWKDSAQMSVFVQQQARPAAVEQLQQRLREHPQIESLNSISPEQALAEFAELSGLGNVLQSLESNPLPTVFVVQPVSQAPETLKQLAEELGQDPLIEKVQLDLDWLRRLHEMLELGQRVVLALALVLVLGVILIIGNTLRLAIENRREEVVVVKMVGGTDDYVRRPFLYTGFWYGFGGGVLAAVLLKVLDFWLSAPLERLLSLYEQNPWSGGFGGLILLVLVVLASLLGWIAAWVAVKQHLDAIEPS